MSIKYFSFFCRRSHVQNKDLNALDKYRKFTSEVANQINRVLLNALAADNPHLSEIEVDLDPRHEAFWFVGGISPPELVRKIRQGNKWQKSFANEPVDRQMQYIGTPLIALRHKLPLEALTDAKTIGTEITVPSFKLDPRTLGYTTDHRHGTTIPGTLTFSLYMNCYFTALVNVYRFLAREPTRIWFYYLSE